MDDTVKLAIRSHAMLMARTIGPKGDLQRPAESLAAFANQAYGLDYPRDSDSYGVLHKACYSALWDLTRQ